MLCSVGTFLCPDPQVGATLQYTFLGQHCVYQKSQVSLRETHYPALRDYTYPAFLSFAVFETILSNAYVWVSQIATRSASAHALPELRVAAQTIADLPCIPRFMTHSTRDGSNFHSANPHPVKVSGTAS